MQQTILLTNQLVTGSAFALTEDNENVFIPSKVMHDKGVRPGQKVQAIVVPNMTRPDRTPWMAVYIGEQEALARGTLADEIRADLERGPATALQVSRSIGQPVELVQRKMREMNLPNDTLYALSMMDLLEGEEE